MKKITQILVLLFISVQVFSQNPFSTLQNINITTYPVLTTATAGSCTDESDNVPSGSVERYYRFYMKDNDSIRLSLTDGDETGSVALFKFVDNGTPGDNIGWAYPLTSLISGNNANYLPEWDGFSPRFDSLGYASSNDGGGFDVSTIEFTAASEGWYIIGTLAPSVTWTSTAVGKLSYSLTCRNNTGSPQLALTLPSCSPTNVVTTPNAIFAYSFTLQDTGYKSTTGQMVVSFTLPSGLDFVPASTPVSPQGDWAWNSGTRVATFTTKANTTGFAYNDYASLHYEDSTDYIFPPGKWTIPFALQATAIGTFTFSGTVTGGGSVSSTSCNTSIMSSVVTPITILDFKTTVQNNDVINVLRTATELNTLHIILERSSDGIHFTQVALPLPAAGNSSSVRTYTIIDYNVPKGTWYYRFKEVALDGRMSYTAINVAKITTANDVSIVLYPNPVSDALYIKGSGVPMIIDICDMYGRRVLTATNASSINVRQLPNGIYTLRVNGQQIRFVKQ